MDEGYDAAIQRDFYLQRHSRNARVLILKVAMKKLLLEPFIGSKKQWAGKVAIGPDLSTYLGCQYSSKKPAYLTIPGSRLLA